MVEEDFEAKVRKLFSEHAELIDRPNREIPSENGIYSRYQFPILTSSHTPVHWRFDLNPQSNPLMLERFGVNSTFNAGALKWNGRYLLMVRVEGVDRKSFFAVAESPSGVDRFRFWDYPAAIPEAEVPDTNVYDMRITVHEDGWVYGLFCTERKDPRAPKGDESSAVAQCGIVRTRDLVAWDRLPDLVTFSGQQRNVVLHPEFVDGKYALYTRPQDGFIDTGSGGGIGFGLTDTMVGARLETETVIEPKLYHTVKEVKNGLGPPPIRTDRGWLHLAHGVRNTAAGLRYVLYLFMTALDDPSRVIHRPAGYFLAPRGAERVGDVSNVAFSNGWIADPDGTVFIYYASSDTRMHVARSTVERLVDYCVNTAEDCRTSAGSVRTLTRLIDSNLSLLRQRGWQP